MPNVNGDGRFNGCYPHKVDDKGRVPIPFRWRPEKSLEFTLIIWPKHQAGTCLRGLLPAQWEKMLADIEAMPNDNPNKAVLKRRIGGTSAWAKVDNVGRIALPDYMRSAAGIESEATLVGMFDRFEIWKPALYKRVVELDDAVYLEALKNMQ